MTKRLLAVFAHPDDDAFAIAGTVAIHATDPDFRFALVLATNGDDGPIAPGSGATRETLGAFREAEDRAAWRAVGRPPDRHDFLGYPDGHVAEVPRAELRARIFAIVRDEAPDVVVTFGPDGVTANPDHMVVGAVTTEAIEELARGTGRRPRLLYTALPDRAIRVFDELLVDARLPPTNPHKELEPRGVPDDAIGVDVDTSSVWRRKLAGYEAHRTQRHDLEVPWMSERALQHEYFVVAPPFPRLAGRLGDVFEAL